MPNAPVPSVVDTPSHGGQHGASPHLPRLCLYFGFCPSSLVLTRAACASEMHWASMAMHYTASMPSMQAESDGKVKYDNKKKEYKCPCPEKVCNYPVFARVNATFAHRLYAWRARKMGHLRTQNRLFASLPDVNL